ncbi:MAG TPA: alpha/beta hydrolase [Verrucomicrobiae bacterium]|nr:alpha/beta hydrolase [Verrucomicrobiae bacterium]
MFDSVPLQRSQVGPTRYAWRRFGEGPALLLIHGFPLSGATWRKVLPELAQHYTCYVPDLAGLGDTEWSTGTDFTWFGQARGLKDWVTALGLLKYHLMAHDTGGTFARCLALADPQRVEKLVLINTEIPHHRPQWIPQYQALMHVPGALASFSLLLRSRAFRRSTFGFGGCFDDLSLIDGDFHERFVVPLLRDARRLQGMRQYLVNLKWDVVDALAQDNAHLTMPVRLIWGADDPFFPLAHARPMVRQFPHASMVEIPRARLLVHEERPAEVARAALDFLRAA